MARPDRIRIPYFENDDRFGLVGKCDVEKQFMAFVTGAFPKDWWSGRYSPAYLASSWERKKRWYAVLHVFDGDGSHIRTEAWSGGTTHDREQEASDQAGQKLKELLRSLGGIRYCDIDVKTFGVEVEGYFFGLVYELNSYDDPANLGGTYECVMLQPNDIMFHPPWDSCDWSS